MKNLFQTVSILLFIMFILSCEQNQDAIVKTDYRISINYSSDTIQPISENVPLIGTCFNKNSFIDEDTIYHISINDYAPSSDIETKWELSIWIPKELYDSEGLYMLGNFMRGNWIELRSYFIEDNITRIAILNSYDIDDSGYFELYNETDSTVNLRFTNINLYNSYLQLSAKSSCDLVIRKCGGF